MPTLIAQSLDALATWRVALERQIAVLAQALTAHDLLDETDTAVLAALRDRLASDKLVLAFVAEFSRGKSELINAIFFSDAGRRVLPATPGRTTMCPVELRCDEGQSPQLSLLPIETRLQGLTLAELRVLPAQWQQVPLQPQDPQSLVAALAAVTATQWVSLERATELGFWNTEQSDDNPPQAADGRVEVPTWRHALIQYPHPLLQRGLVVIDTPGLNAIGAEPELTLGLLPTAHAIVFVLAADTGVTRSDLSIWRDHLGTASLERFVALNKIDTLVDPLSDPLTSAAEVAEQIEQQRQRSAQTLGVPLARVYALSARDALAARLNHDQAGLAASRLPALERALAGELLPRRQTLLVQSALSVVQQLRAGTLRRLVDRRRLLSEQLIELRGLRGKSGTKLRVMVDRVVQEIADFERCNAQLAAQRSVQRRILKAVTAPLSSDALRAEVSTLQAAMAARALNLGARAAFDALMVRLRQALLGAQTQADEMRQMLEASFSQLNTEFGFAFSLPPVPDLADFHQQLELLQQNYGRYLGLSQIWRMAAPGFAEQFLRMLLSKLRVLFESACGDMEQWSRSATSQVEAQLRERRRGFNRRREALQRVQSASGELETRIAEVQSQDDKVVQLQGQIDLLAAAAMATAQSLTLGGETTVPLRWLSSLPQPQPQPQLTPTAAVPPAQQVAA